MKGKKGGVEGGFGGGDCCWSTVDVWDIDQLVELGNTGNGEFEAIMDLNSSVGVRLIIIIIGYIILMYDIKSNYSN